MRKGFSLIELLIVIAIIGIIATIAIPILLSARNAAIDEKGRNSLRAFVSAEAAFYAQNGEYDTPVVLEGAGFLDVRWVDFAAAEDQVTSFVAVVAGDQQSWTATMVMANSAATSFTATDTGNITSP